MIVYTRLRGMGEVCNPPEIREPCKTCICYTPDRVIPTRTKHTTLCFNVWWHENVVVKEGRNESTYL